MRKNIIVIGNPIAGGNAVRKIEKGAAIMRGKGHDVKVLFTSQKGDAESFAKEITAHPPFPAERLLVVAAGGDGTYNEVANGLVHSNIPMAILPLGTTSVLAKELNLPQNIASAVHAALEGKIETIHLGKITLEDSNKLLVTKEVTRYFLLMAGVGFDGETLFGLSEKIKRYTGKGAYLFSGIKTFFRYSPLPITLEYRESPDSPLKKVEGYAAIIGNAACYGGAFKATPDTTLAKPYFHVFVTRKRGRLDLLRYVSGVVRGCHLSYPDTVNFRATEIEVQGSAHIQIDGDYAGTAPAKIEIVRNALQLVTGI